MAQSLILPKIAVNPSASNGRPAPVPLGRGEVKTRLAQFEDYPRIAALQTRNGLSTRSCAAWSALWAENPAYLQRPSDFPLGWVLEDRDGQVRGYLGNVLLAYEFRGRRVRAATPFSWVVDPGYRFHSLDLQRRFVSEQNVDLFVYTTPDAVTEKVLRAFSFSRVTVGQWDTAGFWITDYPGFARSVLRSVSLPTSLAYPVSAGLFLADARRREPQDASGEKFELYREFDSRFDDFWQELHRENPQHLLAVRDQSTLAWHFRGAAARKDLWILTASRVGRMVAYAIFDRHDNPELQLKRVRFTDFQALRGFEELLRPALNWMLGKCRREGIHAVENVGCWLDRFRVNGVTPPHRRRLQSWLFYYQTRDRELSRQLQDPAVWVPSSFDGDASI
jgi:hypothetical protein